MKNERIKRMLSKVLAFALAVTSVVNSTVTAFADIEDNISGGGGGMGGATEENVWHTGWEGIRVTALREKTFTQIGSTKDFSNMNPDSNMRHGGKHSKLYYTDKGFKSGSLSLKMGGYSANKLTNRIPMVIPKGGSTTFEGIKRYFCTVGNMQMLAKEIGFDYDEFTKNEVVVMVEPIAYFKYKGSSYAMTATEASLCDEFITQGGKESMLYLMGDLTHQNLPLSMFLAENDVGLGAYSGSTSGYQSNKSIFSKLGLGTFRARDLAIVPPAGGGDTGTNQLTILKEDEEDGFEVSGALVQVTGDNGFSAQVTTPAVLSVDYGEYTIQEVLAPYGYVLNDHEYHASFPEPPPPKKDPVTGKEEKFPEPDPVTITIEDERQKGRFYITKKDRETNALNHNNVYIPQGDGSFEGAKFEIRAKEDIVLVNGDEVYSKGELVQTITTDKNGKCQSKLLELGMYTVQEVELPKGYLYRDYKPEGQVVTVENAYTTQDIDVNEIEFDYANSIIKGDITMYKYYEGEVLNGVTPPETKEPVQNVYFGIYLKSKLGNNAHTKLPDECYIPKPLDPANPPSYTNPTSSYVEITDTGDIYKKDLYMILKTDEHGRASTKLPSTIYYAVTDPLNSLDNQAPFSTGVQLPYGTYEVVELNTPEGYQPVRWDVDITEHEKEYHYRKEDGIINQRIQIYKRDSETLKLVPASGVKFKIWSWSNIGRTDDETQYEGDGNWIPPTDERKGEYIVQRVDYPTPHDIDIYQTNEQGWFEMPKPLVYGDYEIHEVEAPFGYVLKKEPIPFRVKNPDEDVKVIVDVHNTPQKGKLIIEKVGNVLIGTEEYRTELGLKAYKPIYEKTTIGEGAVYELRAREDVVTPEGTVRFTKDQLIQTLETDISGTVKSQELWLGKYYIKEIKPPHGYVIDNTEYDFQLTYKGQEISVYPFSMTQENARQNVQFKVLKEFLNEEGNIVPADEVYFGLYTREDIKNPKYIAPADKVVATDLILDVVDIDVTINNEMQIMTTFVPADTTEIELKYSDYDTNIIDIDSNGIIKAKALGETPFKVTTLNGIVKEGTIRVTKIPPVTEPPASTPPSGKAIVESESKVRNVPKTEAVAPPVIEPPKENSSITPITPETEGKVEAPKAPTEPIIPPVENNTDTSARVEELKVLNSAVIDGVPVTEKEDKTDSSIAPATPAVEEIKEVKNINGLNAAPSALPIIDPSICIQKDTLIEVIEINEGFGMSKLDLPLGKYYLKELKAPDNYLMSDKEYEIEFSYSDKLGTVVTITANEGKPIINYPTTPPPPKPPSRPGRPDKKPEEVIGKMVLSYNTFDMPIEDEGLIVGDGEVKENIEMGGIYIHPVYYILPSTIVATVFTLISCGRKKRKRVVSGIMCVMMIGNNIISAYAVEDEASFPETIQHEFVFTDYDKDFKYEAPNKLSENKKNYKLCDIEYVIINEKIVEKPIEETITLEDLSTDEAPKTYDMELDENNVITLQLKEATIEEKPNVVGVKGEIDFGYTMDKPVPPVFKEVTYKDKVTGKIKTAKAKLKALHRTEDFQWQDDKIDGKLYGGRDVTAYQIGEETIVPYNSNAPAYRGYENEILNYLGIDKENFKIKESSWTTGFEKDDNGNDYRLAEFRGQRRVARWVATYETGVNTTPSYVATATYTNGIQTEKVEYTVKAIATYSRYDIPVLPVAVATTAGAVGIFLILWFKSITVVFYNSAGKRIGHGTIKKCNTNGAPGHRLQLSFCNTKSIDISKPKLKTDNDLITVVIKKHYARKHVADTITFTNKEEVVLSDYSIPMTVTDVTVVL